MSPLSLTIHVLVVIVALVNLSDPAPDRDGTLMSKRCLARGIPSAHTNDAINIA